MNPHDWFIENRYHYVARSLDPEDERAFSEHLAGCGECREEVGRIERDLAWLPMGVDPMAPRPGLRRRLVDGVLGTGVRRWRWAAPVGIAASLGLAATIWAFEHSRAASLHHRVAQLEERLEAVQDTLSITRNATRVLQANIALEGYRGGLTIFADERTHRWNVMVHGLPPARAGEVYQFWFICEDRMVRGAQVHPDASRPAFMTLGMPAVGGKVMGAALTMEPVEEKSTEPTGKQLAHLML